MKILLVIKTEKLLENLSILNPELEYCAIVVDEVETAEEFFDKLGWSQIPLYPMEKFKSCAEYFEYDYLIIMKMPPYGEKIIRECRKYNIPENKVMVFFDLSDNVYFAVERRLRYYKKHSQEFELFITGISESLNGIDTNKFKYKAINLATPGQDFYYDFQIAKSVILYGGGIVRYDMLSSVLLHIHFTLTFLGHIILKFVYHIILLLLMICTISLCLSIFTKNFFVKNI